VIFALVLKDQSWREIARSSDDGGIEYIALPQRPQAHKDLKAQASSVAADPTSLPG
jgi:hypothetical protein